MKNENKIMFDLVRISFAPEQKSEINEDDVKM